MFDEIWGSDEEPYRRPSYRSHGPVSVPRNSGGILGKYIIAKTLIDAVLDE